MIELLIVIVVIGILAMIGYPSYIDYLQRSTLIEASNMLTQNKISMEQYFQSKRDFSASKTGSGPCAPRTGTAFTYTCKLDGKNPENYILTVTGISKTRADGFTYSIDQNGSRSMTADATQTGPGWPTNANCWIFKRNEKC